MSDAVIGSAPFFNRGLDRIVETPDAPALPSAGFLSRATLPRIAEIEELLLADNLEALLDAYVRPSIVERELLAPLRFRRAMQLLLTRFRRTAQGLRGADARAADLVEGGAKVLDEEIELRHLLEMYQLALLAV